MALSENDRHDDFLSRRQLPALDAGSFATILPRRSSLIGSVTLAFALAGLAYAMLGVPRYMASGRIFVDRSAVSTSQVSALTAPALLDRVVVREKLEADPLFGGRSRETVSLLLSGLGLAPPADPHAFALGQLKRAVSAKSGSDPDFIDVQALTSDRQTSMRVANAVMDAYIEDQIGARTDTPRPTDNPQSASSVQTRLKDAEQRYEKYRSEAGSNITDRVSTAEKNVSTLSDRLAAAEAKVDSLRSAARTRRTDVDPDTVRGGAINALRSRYAAAKRLQDELSETLGPRHPDMVIAKLQASDAKRALDQAIRDKTEDRIESSAAELDRARNAASDLKSRLESAKKDLVKVKDVSVRQRELERDVEINRAAYQASVTKSPEVSGQRTVVAPSIRIVSRAAQPTDSVGTPRLLVLLTSILLGLVAGIALALLLELRPEWSRTTKA